MANEKKWIYKDYYFEDGCLIKSNIKEKEQLMRKKPFFGSPGIDADVVWDKWQDRVEHIKITTEHGKTFKTTKDNFNQNKIAFNYGYGNQYGMAKENWEIIEKNSAMSHI